MVIYAAVGGRLSLVGAVYGTLIICLAKSLLSEQFPSLWMYFMGVVFILTTMVFPKGLSGALDRFRGTQEER
jgi:urea transport system permease protein